MPVADPFFGWLPQLPSSFGISPMLLGQLEDQNLAGQQLAQQQQMDQYRSLKGVAQGLQGLQGTPHQDPMALFNRLGDLTGTIRPQPRRRPRRRLWARIKRRVRRAYYHWALYRATGSLTWRGGYAC
jgi:hypothetical protein